jgi:putative ABC transport system permease protein
MNLLRRIFGRARLNQDLEQEIRGHVEQRVEELIARGMGADDAGSTARREFGNALAIEERGRDVWRWGAIEDFAADLRFAWRQQRRSPAFAAAAVATLALGIGANTAVFSVVDAVILRPLPFRDSGRLVSIQMRDTRGTPHPDNVDYPTFFDLRERNQAYEHIVSYRSDSIVLTGYGQAVQLRGQIVSWDLFPLLGVQPLLGRGFTAEEEAAGQRVAVVSYATWKGRLGGDSGIIGHSLTMDREPYTVVGVAPEGFTFPLRGRPVDVWVTLARDGMSQTIEPVTRQRGARMLDLIARTRPGVSLDQARTDADRIASALAVEYPDSNRNTPGTFVKPELERVVGSMREPMLILLGAVGLVLLIMSANIANLMLARNAERQREFALRAAIGAGRGRMVRQAMAESLALAAAGCTAGVLAAYGLLRVIQEMAVGVPRLESAGLDARVLGYSIAIALATSMLFGLPPALRMLGAGLAWKSGSRTSTETGARLRSVLAAAQVALGLVLLSGASTLAASFIQLMQRDSGFQPEKLLTFSVSLPGAEYSKARQIRFHDRLLGMLAVAPGSDAAAVAMPLPLTGSQMTISFNIEERPAPPAQRPGADVAIVSESYFRTIGLPLLKGRVFTERDDPDAPGVIVVNRAFAEKFFPGEDPIGKRVLPGASGPKGGAQVREIVGVVGNARLSLLRPEEPQYYLSYRQLRWCCPSVLVRSAAPEGIAPSIRGMVAQLDGQLAVDDLRTGKELLSSGVVGPLFQMVLMGAFAAIALVVTAVGLYGLIAYSVARRTREMGVRLALGATPGAVKRMVLREAARIVGLGIAAGLAGALASGKLLAGMVYGVKPGDPVLLGLACLIFSGVAAIAAYVPARRASRIDPIAALGTE